MKKIILALATLVLIVSVTLWGLHGFNTGWTTTQTAVPFVDDITGIESVNYIEELTLGIDALAVGLVLSFLLFAGSFIFKSSNKKS